jgi:hypothetical protein
MNEMEEAKRLKEEALLNAKVELEYAFNKEWYDLKYWFKKTFNRKKKKVKQPDSYLKKYDQETYRKVGIN